MGDDNLCTVEWNATAGNAAAAPGSLPESVALPLGATLAALSGLFLALSMVIQRYALAYPTYHVNVIVTRLPRPAVWSIGFAVYFAANLLFAYSSTLTPLTLNATLFTLLLVWNLLFSWLCLHERIAPPRAIGAVQKQQSAGRGQRSRWTIAAATRPSTSTNFCAASYARTFARASTARTRST